MKPEQYYRIPPEELGRNSKLPMAVMGDCGEVFYEIASFMCDEIRNANEEKRPAVFIVPVGPVGQYPIFARLVNSSGLSLKNCWFFNMDEYLDCDKNYIDKNSPLSFRGFMEREVYNRIRPELLMPERQRLFPDPENPSKTDSALEALGGADVCIGGIGITGHLAFNEPQPSLDADDFARLPTRVLEIAPETITTNCIGDLGGAIDMMPRRCVTIGMKQILSAKKLRLAVFRDWHRAVCRRAAYGEITSAFPATLAQKHPDAKLFVSGNASKLPF